MTIVEDFIKDLKNILVDLIPDKETYTMIWNALVEAFKFMLSGKFLLPDTEHDTNRFHIITTRNSRNSSRSGNSSDSSLFRNVRRPGHDRYLQMLSNLPPERQEISRTRALNARTFAERENRVFLREYDEEYKKLQDKMNSLLPGKGINYEPVLQGTF